MGMCFVTQNLGSVKTQFGNFQHDFLIVEFIILKRSGTRGNGHFLAQFAVVGIGHKRNITRMIQGKNPAFFFLAFRQRMSGFSSSFRQSSQIIFVGNMQFESMGFCQDIFAKLQTQLR